MKIVLNTFHEYLKYILQQILDSYQVLAKLNDESGDLEIIRKESAKIKGLFYVIENKLAESELQSDNIVTLHKLSSYYITNYDFSREIEILSLTYYNDLDRLKSIRLTIIDSLNDKKLVEKIETIKNNF